LKVKGLVSISVFDHFGHLIAIDGVLPRDADLSSEERAAIDNRPGIQKEIKTGGSRLHYLEKIDAMGEGIGFISISYQLTDVEQERIQSFLIFAALLISIFLLMITLLNRIFYTTVLRPLSKMADAMDAVSRGDLESRILVSRRDEIGKLGRSFNKMTDRLQEKQVSLQTAEEKYRQIFENAIEGIFQTSHHGRFLQVNSAMARMFGYSSPGEMVFSVTDIAEQCYAVPQYRNKLLEWVKKNGSISAEEARFRKKDGTIFWGVLSLRFVPQKNGLIYYEGSLTDITEKKEKERAETERQAAEAASRSKSEFLANMSHEIRTPLNAILGFSEILLQESENSRQTEFLSHIYSSGTSLLHLINDILDLSKIEAGKLDIQPEPFHIDNLLQEIEAIFQDRVKIKGLDLSIDMEKDIPGQLIMDERRIRQILINLVGNAVKFTKRGSIRINIAWENINRIMGNTRIRIRVIDTGIGILPEEQSRVFESFYQQPDLITKSFEGTGLGLTISKRLTEMMNGTISMQSEKGKGSTFQVIFHDVPFIEKKDTDNTHSISGVLPKYLFDAATVLVVDDAKLNRKLIRNYLKPFPIAVIEAENGDQALTLLQKGPIPDVIIMDLKMPIMDGYEATSRIKHSDSFCNIPIIACTAAAMKSDEARIIHLFDSFLRKPVHQYQLLEKLKNWLPHHQSHEADNPKDEDYNIPASETLSVEFSALLTEHFISKWEEIRDSFFIDDIESFAEQLKEVSTRYDSQLFLRYSQDLSDSAKRNSIDEIEKQLERFPSLLARVSILKKAEKPL